MKNPIYQKTYQVSINNVNINKRLGLFGMLGYLQDIATVHGEEAGFGIEDMIKDQSFWVLVRQKLRMDRFPHWNEVIEIKTWSRAPEGMYAFREFEIFLNGEKIGDCSTVWMILDGVTRKVKKPDFPMDKINPRTDYHLDYIAHKVEVRDNFEKVNTITVRNSDLDLNMHVNNTKYSQWILDSIPIELHKTAKLNDFEINFMAETHLGDKIDILRARNEEGEVAHDIVYKGIRESDGKTCFLAKLLAD
ncbi:acyl-[acyl-carrier-protein] thioesterase [Halobacteriovorax sp. RT-2-4]|uniref:acyl-[acyl-carrier-protein] thioesterase n=1 Tax=unclassified Halobacteriovorax TaxID=2639665 RepID=UPI00399A5A14